MKERGVSRSARLMTQLVHTRRACVHFPCVSFVLVIVSMADLRPYSFEPEYGLDERVDEASCSDEDDEAACSDEDGGDLGIGIATTTAKSELETLPGVAVACVLQCQRQLKSTSYHGNFKICSGSRNMRTSLLCVRIKTFCGLH